MSIVPAGVLRFSYANVDEIDSTVIPYAANLSGSTKTWISRFGAPDTDIVPTPLTRAKGVATLSSNILSRPLRLSAAVADNNMIGMSSILNLNIVGVLTASGSICATMSNLSRTSFVASVISMPYSNSNEMTDMFSLEVEERCFKLLTPLRAFSKGLLTLVSMSAALAPEYDVTTNIVFSPMSGKRLVDNLVRENTPKIATAMKIRAIVTGLFTDVLYKLIFLIILRYRL